MNKRNYFYIIALITILFAFAGTCYLSNFYVLERIAGTAIANISMPFLGYILQAAGMFVYAKLFNKYNHIFTTSKSSILLILLTIVVTFVFQLSRNIYSLIVFSFIFNFVYGLLTEMYLIQLTYVVEPKHRGLCFGVSYALGSIFSFLATYFDGGKLVESPSMLIIYVAMLTIACLLCFKNKKIIIKEKENLGAFTTKYLSYLLLGIIGLTIVMSLGDGLYTFGTWASKADLRVVRLFYGIGLILAGFINDKSKKLGSILAYACLSYYLISSFLLNNILSPSINMSLGYFFMSFISIYRYTSVADLIDNNPSYIAYSGLGLMISRVTEGITVFLMFLFPLSLTMHTIVTVVMYSPLIIIAVAINELKFKKSVQSSENKLAIFSEEHSFTSREEEIFKMILDNASDEEIASKLFISKPTVRFHISNILKKTNTKSRIQAKLLYEKQ